jgi:hypothetical protein
MISSLWGTINEENHVADMASLFKNAMDKVASIYSISELLVVGVRKGIRSLEFATNLKLWRLDSMSAAG